LYSAVPERDSMNRDYVFAIVGLALIVFAGSIVAAAESTGYFSLFAIGAAVFAVALLFREAK